MSSYKLPSLPRRSLDAHKGHFGRLQIIGGNAGMAGAPALAARAALRAGAGLVQVVCPVEVQSVVAGLVPCATTSTRLDDGRFRPTVRAVGPGCGTSLPGSQVVELLKAGGLPVVVDADGLNALAEVAHWWHHCTPLAVLTPHAGEMARLIAGTAIPADLEQREQVCQELARLAGCTVVLKGRGTVVTEGYRLFINSTGNPGMATGGSGDVLTGTIAALIGQGLTPFDAACLGVHVHGLAGDIAAERLGQISMTAEDIIDCLPAAFMKLQG